MSRHLLSFIEYVSIETHRETDSENKKKSLHFYHVATPPLPWQDCIASCAALTVLHLYFLPTTLPFLSKIKQI
jgi:hypothetical protein